MTILHSPNEDTDASLNFTAYKTDANCIVSEGVREWNEAYDNVGAATVVEKIVHEEVPLTLVQRRAFEIIECEFFIRGYRVVRAGEIRERDLRERERRVQLRAH